MKLDDNHIQFILDNLQDAAEDAELENGYPPKWNKEVLDKVLDQVENFRTYN